MIFKIDTGAEVSAISETAFDRLPNVKLEKCSRKLYGPAMSPLYVLGQFTTSLTTQANKMSLSFSALNRPTQVTCTHLIEFIVSRLDSVEPTNVDVKKRYPQTFNGLDQFGQEYEVSLKNGAKPFALHTARNIPCL